MSAFDDVIYLDGGLVLRIIREADAPSYWELVEAERRHLSRLDPYTNVALPTYEALLARVQATAAAVEAGEHETRGLFLDGEFVGRLYVALDRDKMHAVLGWMRSRKRRPEVKGLVTKAGTFLIRRLTDQGYVRISAIFDPRNHASRRIAEMLGMVKEGTLRNNVRFGPTTWGNSDVFAIAINPPVD